MITMNTELFSKLLALILLYLYKVPQNKVTPVLREISSAGTISPIDRENINIILSGISSELPEIKDNDWDIGQKIYNDNIENNINILVLTGEGYPKFLRVIKDAPPLLFIKGNLEILNKLPGVAIVGARETSKNGIEIAKRLAAYAVENDWVVVSGLALGIDAAAHTGTLSAGGKTVAVLASGLDKATPAKNSALPASSAIRYPGSRPIEVIH